MRMTMSVNGSLGYDHPSPSIPLPMNLNLDQGQGEARPHPAERETLFQKRRVRAPGLQQYESAGWAQVQGRKARLQISPLRGEGFGWLRV